MLKPAAVRAKLVSCLVVNPLEHSFFEKKLIGYLYCYILIEDEKKLL